MAEQYGGCSPLGNSVMKCHIVDAFHTFFLWESHFYSSVVLTSSHENCETRK